MESTHERLADRTGRGKGRPLESFTLWELNGTRFAMALFKIIVPLTLVCSVGVEAWSSWPSFSMGGLAGLLFVFGLFFSMFGTLYLVFKVDARGSTYCKDPAVHLELSAHDLIARDASGTLLGEVSRGTLRVLRVNVNQGKRGLVGALRLDHAKRSFWLSPLPQVGAWSGLQAESFHETLHILDNSQFDALLRLAE
ncbi:hypothetical protein D7Y13_06830 [Corallococcus praedator]|uniref:Uncharacterized protein n=1 Tax=Corallococcus praedator TaxID=2316724 RepID=A0ABX9QQ27_9BACT|nr:MULTISPECIES: hypothetical protein [Corallococcus]RKH35824.1 hypothetical protein D7X75_02825 [Corallococcus sp. CA031C]RKI13986.1 hypothetical protein D7Y13_06830 [Corallococcus praedator]